MKSYTLLFLESLLEHATMSLVDGPTVLNSNAIKTSIEKYVTYLTNLKISKGKRVVILGKRNAESIIFFHSLLIMGFIPVLIDRTLPLEHIKKLVGDDIVFCTDRNFIKQLGARAIPLLQNLRVNSKPVINTSTARKRGDDILFVTHTSGTTGLPKKVTYTNSNISWAVHEYSKLYNLKQNRVVLFALPFHYCFGFIACCLSTLSVGGTVVLLSETNQTPAQIANTIQKNKVNILVINPFFYTQLCKTDLSEFDFSSLRICDSGGETLPVEIIRKFKNQTNVMITEGYGLTETSSLTHFLLPEPDGKIRIGSVGKPCSDVECKIVDSKLKEVSMGEIGELLVRGPMVINSYDDKSYNKDSFSGSWFKTDDLFYVDEKNYYYLIGRKKDTAEIPYKLQKLVNKKVSSLTQISDVKDLAFKFINSFTLYIYVAPQNDLLGTREKIIGNILESLPSSIKKISKIKFVSSLPRTATGKVKKGVL